jgi:hypothetical protein
MKFATVKWSPDKNEWLKAHRGVSFEAVLAALQSNKVIDDVANANRPHQRNLIVEIKGYICVVPYVWDEDVIFLKTIYPDRKMKEIYRKSS